MCIKLKCRPVESHSRAQENIIAGPYHQPKMDFAHILGQKEAIWNTIFQYFWATVRPPNVAGPGKTLPPSPLSTGLLKCQCYICNAMTVSSATRGLSPIHTADADATRQNSFVASAVCIGLYRIKRLKAHAHIAPNGTPTTELWYVNCHTGSHSVSCHLTQVNMLYLDPSPQAGTRFTYPGGIEGWVDRDGWLHTETVYLLTDSHPSKY